MRLRGSLQTDPTISKLFKPSLPLPISLNLSLQPFSDLTHLTNINTSSFFLKSSTLPLIIFLLHTRHQSTTLPSVSAF